MTQNHPRSHARIATVVLAASLALPLTTSAAAGSAAAATPKATATPITAADLAMTGSKQQRWQSVPESRIVLNPFDRYAVGTTSTTTEEDQNSGPDLPLNATYYANDSALKTSDLMQTYRADQAAPSPDPDPTTPTTAAVTAPFTAANGWSLTNVGATETADGTSITVNAGSSYGRIEKSISVDLATTRFVTLDIAATTGTWNFKVNDGGDKGLLTADAVSVGRQTFDLVAMTGRPSGTVNLGFRIYVSGGAGKSMTVKSITLHGPEADPAADKPAQWHEDMSDVSDWTPYNTTNGASITSNGSEGIIKGLTTKDWAAVKTSVTVNVTDHTKIAIRVPAVSHSWALELSNAGGSTKLQADVSQAGVFVYDLSTTGWSGSTTFDLRLFATKATPGSVAVDDIVIYDEPDLNGWTSSATSFTNTWAPSRLDSHATYSGGGAITATDYFSDKSTVARQIDATGLTAGTFAVTSGVISGTPSWDAQARVLTVTTMDDVRAYHFPANLTVYFGTKTSGNVTFTVSAADTHWFAVLPAGEIARISIGFSPVSTATEDYPLAGAVTAATASATSATDATTATATWDTFWNAFLTKVPAPQDFSLHGVDNYGVDDADVQTAYYRAFINLEQNVLPATPETGNYYVQLGTGKASGWMSGSPGTKNVASWDSLLGMQVLVYADPTTAMESFKGMMALVDDAGDITADSDKGGESLPSRKAQTAWILYQATGDKAALEEVYANLTRHLTWESKNLHWMVKDRGIYNEKQRDSEFVTSLLIDLEYAKKISTLLDHPADVTSWEQTQSHLQTKFDDWFIQADGSFAQKINLAADDDSAAVTGVASTGDSSAVLGALHAPGLSAAARTAIKTRMTDWDATKQFAGLGSNLKAPNAQFITYGLLDQEQDSAKAGTLVGSIIRDVVRTGWFAEVYKQSGNGTSDAPVTDGVRPSLFGLSMFIDAVWQNNGYRLDIGEPSFVRLSSDNDGGINGLTTLGKTFNFDLNGSAVDLSGDAFNWSCATLPIGTLGNTVTAGQDCTTALDPVVTTTEVSLDRSTQVPSAPAGARATATVTVQAASGVAPTGTVTLQDVTSGEPVVLGTSEVATGEVASTATIEVPATIATGDRSLRAVYIADKAERWAGSTSSTIPLSVVAATPHTAPVAVALSVASGSMKAGSKQRATVTVTTTGTWSTAPVTIRDNGRVVATVTVPASKSGEIVLPASLTVGTHRLVATFAGGPGLNPGTSQTATFTVTKATATMTLKRSKASIKAGKKVTIRLKVAAPAGVTRTGKAVVRVRGKKVATVKVPSTGMKTFKVTLKKRGKNIISVRYLGSTNLKEATKKITVRAR